MRVSERAAWALLVCRIYTAAAIVSHILLAFGVQRRPLRIDRTDAQGLQYSCGVEGDSGYGCPLCRDADFEEEEERTHVFALGKVAGVIGGGPDDAAPRGHCGEGGGGEHAPASSEGGDAEVMKENEGGDGT
jgi:hypothetical protein